MPMKKDRDIIKCIFMTAIFLILFPTLSFADTIILKHGRPIRTEKAWEEDEHIFFFLHGLKMKVAKKEVHRIVKTDPTSPTPSVSTNNNNDSGLKVKKPTNTTTQTFKVDPLPIEKPAVEITKKDKKCVLWSGFRDFRWGIERSTFDKLREVETSNQLAEVKEYARAKEDLNMGNAHLKSIIYAFWRDQLYSITLWVEGNANYHALRHEIFTRFGAGSRNDQNQERYLWSDPYSDRMLKYISEDHTGLFWMRSKELDSQYRLSQIKIPSSYLEALEANVLQAN